MKKGKSVKGPFVIEFGSYFLNNELGNYEALQIKHRGSKEQLVITDKFGKSRTVSIEESLRWAAKRMKQNGELVDEDSSFFHDEMAAWFEMVSGSIAKKPDVGTPEQREKEFRKSFAKLSESDRLAVARVYMGRAMWLTNSAQK